MDKPNTFPDEDGDYMQPNVTYQSRFINDRLYAVPLTPAPMRKDGAMHVTPDDLDLAQTFYELAKHDSKYRQRLQAGLVASFVGSLVCVIVYTFWSTPLALIFIGLCGFATGFCGYSISRYPRNETYANLRNTESKYNRLVEQYLLQQKDTPNA